MISDHYNENVSVERLTVVMAMINGHSTATNKKTFTAHIATLPCSIQAFDEDITKDITNGFGKDLRLFCAIADIEEGDRIIRGSDEYRISAIKSFPNYGDNSHMELRIRAFKS